MALASHDHFERLVIVILANLTLSHIKIVSRADGMAAVLNLFSQAKVRVEGTKKIEIIFEVADEQKLLAHCFASFLPHLIA
jgi:hypothetical protein